MIGLLMLVAQVVAYQPAVVAHQPARQPCGPARCRRLQLSLNLPAGGPLWRPSAETPEPAAADPLEPQWEKAIVPFKPTTDPFQVAKRLLPVLLFHFAWSVLVVALSTRCSLSAPPLLHSLLGGVLGLLLAFRTNQAYTRYQQFCTAWAKMHCAALNLARTAAQLDFPAYSAVMRHLIAFPVAVKQSLRNRRDDKEYYNILRISEFPHLSTVGRASSLISTIALLLRPVKARDDGSGRELALWGVLERGCDELQGVASEIELLQQLRPPESYSLLVSRFLLAWSATLPFAMMSVMPCRWLVPPVMLVVAWTLYSTEELAQLMEEPCGNPRKPESLPLDEVCASLLAQLKVQVLMQRRLERRVAERSWVVTPEDLEPYGMRPRRAAAAGAPVWPPGGDIDTSATPLSDDDNAAWDDDEVHGDNDQDSAFEDEGGLQQKKRGQRDAQVAAEAEADAGAWEGGPHELDADDVKY